MFYCGAIIIRTGHLNTSSGIALTTKGIVIKRSLSTLSRSTFQRSRLLDSSAKYLPVIENVDKRGVSAARIIVKCINSTNSRSTCLRRIHTDLRAQCSSYTADLKKKQEIVDISKDEIISETNFTDGKSAEHLNTQNILKESEDTEHRTHTRKEHEIKISDIEKLYPNAREKLNSFYQSVGSQLNIPPPIKVYFSQPMSKHHWICTYKLSWPKDHAIATSASSKSAALKIGAIKVLHWLHVEGKVKNGLPMVYDSKTVADMLNKPTEITIEPDMLYSIKRLLDKYKSEIDDLIKNSNNSTEITDVALSEENLSDPIGRHSHHQNWEEINLLRRNKILQSRYADRSFQKSKSLPINEYREKIIQEIEANRALLIKGDTGCGKTTQVPQFIMESYESRGSATDCNIIVAQPRRISAISLAERIAYERNESVGDVVGYQVRLKQILPRTPGAMLLCTSGILLKKLHSNPNLEGCSHVILDEAHERTINIDMLLVLLKRALQVNKKLKVIIMSATINADLFQNYFNCNVINVPGRTFPVEMNFLEDVERLGIMARRLYMGNQDVPEVPYIDHEQIGDLIHWINEKKPPGAILCFLPGWAEIMKVKNYIEDRSRRDLPITILPVHSRMSNHDQKKIFDHPPPGVRKIVLATDIAETGITVTDVVYVVDSATHKAMKWHEKKGFASIENQYASQANILQRKGRAGRVQPGTSYHLISRAQFDHLDVHPLPEVLRSSLEKTVLDCKTYSNEKAETFLNSMPQPPTLSALKTALNDLVELGALDSNENLTPLGKRIALFAVHPKLSKALVYSSIFQCVAPIVTIASAMSADNDIFMGTLYNKESIRRIKQKYHPGSDHVSIGWIFTQWAAINRQGRYADKDFCRSTKLYPERMFTLSKVRDLHVESLVQCRMLKNIDEYDNYNTNCNEYAELDELVRGVLLAGVDQLLHHRDFELRNHGVKKGTSVFIMENGNRGTITPESVNFKRASWPSPFLTYVHKQHSEERRTSLIRETSMVSPLTALLFSQGPIFGYELPKQAQNGDSSDKILLTIKGRKNFRLSCDRQLASTLLEFRNSMWRVVRYIIERQGFVENIPGSDYHQVESYKQSMLRILGEMLSEAASEIDKPIDSGKEKKQKHQPHDGFSDEESY